MPNLAVCGGGAAACTDCHRYLGALGRNENEIVDVVRALLVEIVWDVPLNRMDLASLIVFEPISMYESSRSPCCKCPR
jgi:hypothetical protein